MFQIQGYTSYFSSALGLSYYFPLDTEIREDENLMLNSVIFFFELNELSFISFSAISHSWGRSIFTPFICPLCVINTKYHWHKKIAGGVLKQEATFFHSIRLFHSHLEMCELSRETLVNLNNGVWSLNCSEHWALELGTGLLLMHSMNSDSAVALQDSRN